MFDAESMIALASLAGSGLVSAAMSDTWQAIKHRFAAVLSHHDNNRIALVQARLERIHEALSAPGADVEQVRGREVEVWTVRLTDLLEERPSAAAELQSIVDDLRRLGVLSTGDPTVGQLIAGDVINTAISGGVAAATIQGGVVVNPTQPERT